MVLTESMKMAAFTGNAAEVTAFLEKNPEGVDDVGEQGRTMIHGRRAPPQRRPGVGEGRASEPGHLDVHAPE